MNRNTWIAAVVSVAISGCALASSQGPLRPGGVVYPADPAGLFERLHAGNIDQVGSEAYNRWGKGYEKGIAASDRRLTRVANEPR